MICDRNHKEIVSFLWHKETNDEYDLPRAISFRERPPAVRIVKHRDRASGEPQ
jgi:hypothetical protein